VEDEEARYFHFHELERAGNMDATYSLLHVLGGAEHMAELCEHVALGSLHHFIVVLSCRCKFKKEKKNTKVFGSL